ncbi:hypothetical protein Glove_346g128 [Diversispora epigaea]|uniref:BTB domain-containing protein n=1 Tax=Diversispora epigaea TaxID=1348612 RepID=A0A397HF83_9GLOM|nr:hypothetical protein Glove_346g128 [Diversispora epigaea]
MFGKLKVAVDNLQTKVSQENITLFAIDNLQTKAAILSHVNAKHIFSNNHHHHHNVKTWERKRDWHIIANHAINKLDFSELIDDKKEYNVIIEVGKEENKKSFTTHSVVLRYRSSYFEKELENAPTNRNYIKTIIKPNISVRIFKIILKYIYGGIVNIENADTKTIYELMINASELELKECSGKLERYLIESKAS